MTSADPHARTGILVGELNAIRSMLTCGRLPQQRILRIKENFGKFVMGLQKVHWKKFLINLNSSRSPPLCIELPQ